MHNLQDSSENYLEAIYVLYHRKGHVRSIDIANFLNLSRPSVSKAMKKLEDEGHIVMEEDGSIRLTGTGRNIGEEINERHQLFKELFERIGVSPQTADDDACKVEHAISDETFECLKRYLAEK